MLTPEQVICIQCQECCKWMTFTLTLPADALPEYDKYYSARGCKTFYVNQSTIKVIVPSKCPQLTPFGCKNYESRPKLCRLYDGRRDQLMAGRCQLVKLEEGTTNGKKKNHIKTEVGS